MPCRLHRTAHSAACSWDIYRQKPLSSSGLSVFSLLLSLFPVRGALFIGRVSQPWPRVWNIFFVGLIGCRWRLQREETRQQSERSLLPPTCPASDASGTRPLEQNIRRRAASATTISRARGRRQQSKPVS